MYIVATSETACVVLAQTVAVYLVSCYLQEEVSRRRVLVERERRSASRGRVHVDRLGGLLVEVPRPDVAGERRAPAAVRRRAVQLARAPEPGAEGAIS